MKDQTFSCALCGKQEDIFHFQMHYCGKEHCYHYVCHSCTLSLVQKALLDKHMQTFLPLVGEFKFIPDKRINPNH